MNLDRARLALLTVPTAPVWTGTVSTWSAATCALTVANVSGAFPANISHLLLVRAGVDVARVRSRAGQVLTLAETPVAFAPGDTLALYDARLPWPRYQRISNGVVYKDFDLAFPTPWQAAMPPTPLVTGRVDSNPYGEAVHCAVGQPINLTAATSFTNVEGATPLTYAWDASAGGTITGSGATVTAAYSTPGFRYLTLTLTDAHGTAARRYMPVWVGTAQVVGSVTGCRARWDTKSGWTVDIELADPTPLVQYSPALLVDVETRAALWFGFIVPNSRAETFETVTLTATLQSALAFSRFLHAYPFLITSLQNTDTPREWAEVYRLSLARALWHLLYWHSTLPEVVNCDLSLAPLREISGQEFTLGSVPQQMDAVLKSAFWQARGQRAGGLVVQSDPLYLWPDLWNLLSPLALTNPAQLRGDITREYAQPTVNQVRLGGVFRDIGGTYEPALVQAPAAPGPFGSPAEINGLAPTDGAELEIWAGRHIAVENTADRYTLQPGVEVNPATARVVALPDGTRIAVERVDLAFDAAALRWQQGISGRAYGRSVAAVALPLPPPIEYPAPALPPLLPPWWDPLPEPERWADGNQVILVARASTAGAENARILRTLNFRAENPTWEDISPAAWSFVTAAPYGLTEGVRPVQVKINQVTRAVWVVLQGANGKYVVIRSTDAFSSATPTWAALPPLLSGGVPLNYGSNSYQHPRLLFDDTRANGNKMFVRLAECDGSGVLLSSGRQLWMAAFDDALALQGQTFIGWQSSTSSRHSMVEFNDNFSGFLTYTYYTDGGARDRRLDVPCGAVRTTVNPLVSAQNYISPTDVTLPLRPVVNVGALARLNGTGTGLQVLYATEDQIRAWNNSSPPGTPVGLQMDPLSFAIANTASEQPFARNLGRRPGWVGICGNTSATYGLWLSTDSGQTFTRVVTFPTSRDNVRPALFPNANPYYAVFRRYELAARPARVFAWDVDSATLLDKTGNLNSVVTGAQWNDATTRVPLDVWWGLE